jgi:hypothetical protein
MHTIWQIPLSGHLPSFFISVTGLKAVLDISGTWQRFIIMTMPVTKQQDQFMPVTVHAIKQLPRIHVMLLGMKKELELPNLQVKEKPGHLAM